MSKTLSDLPPVRPTWQKLRAQGIPRSQWPAYALAAYSRYNGYVGGTRDVAAKVDHAERNRAWLAARSSKT